MPTAEATSVNRFANSDVRLSFVLDAKPILVSDLEAGVRFLRTFVAAAEQELQRQIGEPVSLLPVVRVRAGSVEIEVEMKTASRSTKVRVKLRGIVTGMLLLLGATAPNRPEVAVPPTPVSTQCQQTVLQAERQLLAEVEYLGRDVTQHFSARCGDVEFSTDLSVGPSHQRARGPRGAKKR